jgi:DNA-binding SARP family transcriptional activator
MTAGRFAAVSRAFQPQVGRSVGFGRGQLELSPAGHVTSAPESGEARVDFRILGPLDVRLDGAPIEMARGKARALLGMLLLHINQVVSLDHLAAGLWEDSEGSLPPAPLRIHMSRLRQALAGAAAEAVIVTSPRGYTLTAAEAAVDAWRFEQLAGEGRRQLSTGDAVAAAESLEQALSLWRGRVLADLSLSPALEPDLARLEEARLSVTEDRVDAYLACGRHNELVGELEQLVGESPLRERLWGQRIVALYRCGRQSEALRAYEELRVLLREELGIRPSPALQRLEKLVLEQDPELAGPPALYLEPAAAPAPAPAPAEHRSTGGAGVRFPARLAPQARFGLSGRGPQLESLLHTFGETDDGVHRVVLVSGEPGIGKTCLVADAARHAHQAGATVLFGRCDEGMGVPFQPFVEALQQVLQSGLGADSLGRHAGDLVHLVPQIASTFPDLPPPLQADPETERYRLFESVVSWLVSMSSESNVVLVLDDLQWAEKSTLLLLRHLVRSAEPMRLLVLGTYRDTDLDRAHPLAEILVDLRRESCVERVALAGLDLGGVSEMLAVAGGEHVAARADQLGQLTWSETAGNPFFVQEMLASLGESGLLTRSDGAPGADLDISDLAVPEGVREIVGRRLSRLSEPANALLALASVVGAVIDFDVLVAVSGMSEDDVLDALDEASAAALLRETSAGTYEFNHALVRSTLYDELSVARRGRRHRQVAEALEAKGEKDAAALFYHFRRAGSADPRAVDYAVAAGEEAIERLAFDQAVVLFAQALETAEDVDAGPARRCELLVRLGDAERMAGVSAYRETLLRAAQLAEDIGEADLLAEAVLANNRWFGGTVATSSGTRAGARTGTLDEERVRFIEAALAAVGPADSATRARLLSVLALELVWGDPELRRLALADEAVAIARRLDDEACLLEVWTAAHNACSVPDRVPALVAELPELLALAERTGDAEQILVVCGRGFLHSVQMGELREADRLLERIGRLADDVDHPMFRWMEAIYSCSRLTVTATGAEIEQAALKALQIARNAGQPSLYTWFAPQLFAARWSEGRLAEIVDLVRQVTTDNPGLPAFRAALALTCALVGQREEAASIVDDLMVDPAKAFPQNLAWLFGHSVLAEAVAEVGTAEQAAREYALLAPYAGRVPSTGHVARPSVSLALATLAAGAGWPDKAEQHFSAAHEQHERLGATGWLARTQLGWARFVLEAAEPDRALALLARAREGAEEMGVADVVTAVDKLLSELAGRDEQATRT